MSTQIAVALLAQYLDEMGIDRKLLDIASIIPSKDIQILPLHIAQALNVDNTNPPKGKWEIGTSDSGNLFAYIVQKQPRKNALVCFYLARSNQNFIATIVYIIRQNFRSEKYLEDMFNAAKTAYITIDRAHFTFSNVNWRHVGSGEFSTQVILNTNVINALYSGLELEFDASFGSANRDFDPSITFSLDGLRSILAALLKQQG